MLSEELVVFIIDQSVRLSQTSIGKIKEKLRSSSDEIYFWFNFDAAVEVIISMVEYLRLHVPFNHKTHDTSSWFVSADASMIKISNKTILP